MTYSYDEWSDKHKDTIALWVGIVFGAGLIAIGVLTLIYAQ